MKTERGSGGTTKGAGAPKGRTRGWDLFTPEKRSAVMAAVRGKDTKPERAARRILAALGWRFRLHRKDLPGTPDLVFPGLRAIVRVHGCFWHRHDGCSRARLPRTRRAYWKAKFAGNVARDAATERALRRAGWRVLTIWECQMRDEVRLAARLDRFLETARKAQAAPPKPRRTARPARTPRPRR